jgi:hypothetical protein
MDCCNPQQLVREGDKIMAYIHTHATWHADTDTWHANTDTWHANTDTWHANTDTWHANTDTWHASTDTWHADTDTWHANTDTWCTEQVSVLVQSGLLSVEEGDKVYEMANAGVTQVCLWFVYNMVTTCPRHARES